MDEPYFVPIKTIRTTKGILHNPKGATEDGDEGNRTLISAMRPRRAPVTPRPRAACRHSWYFTPAGRIFEAIFYNLFVLKGAEKYR